MDYDCPKGKNKHGAEARASFSKIQRIKNQSKSDPKINQKEDAILSASWMPLGMDFGTRIGKYSKTRVVSRTTKIKKLRRGKKLLEWLAKKSESNLYSTTKIKGLTKINFQDIDNIITSKNAF